MNQHCDALKKRINAFDFAIYDLELYLDTHPTDTAAMTARNSLRFQREELQSAYENACGRYEITASDTQADTEWTWIRDPWPWDYCP